VTQLWAPDRSVIAPFDTSDLPGPYGQVVHEDFTNDAANAPGNWLVYNSSGSALSSMAIGTDTTPGIWAITTGSISTGYTGIRQGYSFKFGTTSIYFFDVLVYVQVLSTGTQSYTTYTGFTNQSTGAVPTNAVMFRSSNGASPVWYIETINGGATTSTSTGVAVALGWHRLRAVVQSVSGTLTATFWLNGVNVGAHTTNIPTGTAGPSICVTKAAGTSNRAFYADFFQYGWRVLVPSTGRDV